VSAARPVRRDLAVTLVGLAALLAWDFSGADLALTRLFADVQGFAWRQAWFTRSLLHDGGRAVSAAVLLAGLVDVWWVGAARGPSRAERWRWTAAVVGSLVAVPALKRLSATSCPWDLAEFGGVARYVSHWQWGVVDGGPGHCFPSGHAVAAFAFFGMYFLWRAHRPALARAWLVGTVAAGLVFGLAQLARGAHFASHTLWTAWLCWGIAVAVEAFSRRRPLRAAPAGGSRA